MTRKNWITIAIAITLIVVSLILLNMSKSFTVYVNYVGGGENYSIEVQNGKKIDQPKTPVLDGFTFLCWSTHGQKYDFNQPVKDDLELVATYQKACNIRFISNDEVVDEFVIAQGTLINGIALPQDDTYVFAGWMYNGELFDFSTPVNRDMDLVAKWDNPIDILKPSQSSITVEMNQTLDIIKYFDYEPKDAVFNATFISSKESVVRMDGGLLSAISLGKATVSIFVGELSASIDVEVISPSIETITLPATLYCDQGGNIELKSMIIPENADKSALSYTVEDEQIASIDKDGIISGLKAGVTTITVSAGNVSMQSTLYVNGIYLDLKLVDAVRTYHTPAKNIITYTIRLVEYYNGECTQTDLGNDRNLLLNDCSNDSCLQIDENNNITLRTNSLYNQRDSFYFTYGTYTSNSVYYFREPEVKMEIIDNIESSTFEFSYLLCRIEPLDLEKNIQIRCNCQLMNVVPIASWIKEWSMSDNVLSFMVDAENLNTDDIAFELKTVAQQEFEIKLLP